MLRFKTTVALGCLAFSSLSEVAQAAAPPRGVLVRGDIGVGPVVWSELATGGGYQFTDTALAVAPVLALNLGYAGSDRIRVGLGASASGTATLAETGGMPYTGLDSLMRWTLGPTVALRFGPKSPLELELGAAVTGMMFAGSQAEVGAPDNIYPLGVTRYGAVLSGLLLYRPGGPDSWFALHGGLNSGFAYGRSGTTEVWSFMGYSQFGVTIGL